MSAAAGFARFDPARVPSPCYVIDLERVDENLRRLAWLKRAAEVRILLALKAFGGFALAERIGAALDGTAASGLYEARLGRTRFGGEVHTYAPGLKAEHLAELVSYSDHLILNSLGQHARFADRLAGAPCDLGLRVNPGHREVENPLYDPCAPWSRLGVPAGRLTRADLAPFRGLHVHGLCDHGFEPFARFLAAVERAVAPLAPAVEWVNLGGGMLITQDGFPLDALAEALAGFKARTGLAVYLEPGTAVVLEAGALVAEVLDTARAQGNVAVMDASATCHAPDVIEAPYTPDLLGAETLPRALDEAATARAAGDPAVWRLGGPTCLAGDVMGTYRMARPPRAGDRLVFLDLAYYTMVKATTFNGTPLPSIALWDPRTDKVEIVRRFDYADFEARLG